MTKFLFLVALAFVVLFLTVNFVSRRSSQLDQVEDRQKPFTVPATTAQPAWQPPAPRPRAAPTSGVLYKCIDAKGHNSFQSQPCPAGAEQAWVRDATPEPAPTRAQLQQQARARHAAERSAAAQSKSQSFDPGPGSTTQASSSSSACQAARAADAAYRRQPLRYVTHHGLRQHGDRIRGACY